MLCPQVITQHARNKLTDGVALGFHLVQNQAKINTGHYRWHAINHHIAYQLWNKVQKKDFQSPAPIYIECTDLSITRHDVAGMCVQQNIIKLRSCIFFWSSRVHAPIIYIATESKITSFRSIWSNRICETHSLNVKLSYECLSFTIQTQATWLNLTKGHACMLIMQHAQNKLRGYNRNLRLPQQTLGSRFS